MIKHSIQLVLDSIDSLLSLVIFDDLFEVFNSSILKLELLTADADAVVVLEIKLYVIE